MEITREKAIAVLFGALGKADDINRQRIYCDLLDTIPPNLVYKAVHKVLAEWRYATVPPVAIILDAAKSLYATKVPETRVKTWEEAWTEINNAMLATPWGKKPIWSTKEIEAAVNAFGWETLHIIPSSEFNTARAQIRRFYEDACKRIADQAVNGFVMGENPKGILGIPLSDLKALRGNSVEIKG